MNLSGLSGLSASYPGYIKAEGDEGAARLKQLAAMEAENQQIGGQAFARAFMAEVPGAGPMPPAPGQPSMPQHPQSPMAGGPPPTMSPAGGAPPGGAMSPGGPQQGPGGPPMQPPMGGAPPGPQAGAPMAPPAGGPGQGSKLGTMDINELAQKIIRANPGIERNPGHLMGALQQALPFMTAQSKMELAQLSQQYKLDQANTARDRLTETTKNHERIDAAKEESRTLKEKLATEHEDRMREQFNSTQERLKNNAKNRYDESHARLERMISRDMTKDQKDAVAAEINVAVRDNNVQHQAIMSAIAANNMLVGDRDKMLQEVAATRDKQSAALEALKLKLRTNSSPGATVKDKVQTQAPAGDPLKKPVQTETILPPEAVQSLKEGAVTTFGNGQKWTLEGGKPKKVE